MVIHYLSLHILIEVHLRGCGSVLLSFSLFCVSPLRLSGSFCFTISWSNHRAFTARQRQWYRSENILLLSDERGLQFLPQQDPECVSWSGSGVCACAGQITLSTHTLSGNSAFESLKQDRYEQLVQVAEVFFCVVSWYIKKKKRVNKFVGDRLSRALSELSTSEAVRGILCAVSWHCLSRFLKAVVAFS